MANLETVYQSLWDELWIDHHVKIEVTYRSIASEAVKIGIAFIILSVLLIVNIRNMSKESNRLLTRYDTTSVRYEEACKAVYRLLPEPVAKKLAAGQHVQPEFFYNASVLVTDIVGFTSICSHLSAIEVLAMLNKIYTVFDARTNANRCYKIETVGDAYIVAAGVPTRDSQHAAEASKLALVLVEDVGMIKMPRKSQKLRIRIGIASGQLSAGIVGVKMLRYCLFGKTVLQANVMEQTSLRKSTTLKN